MPAKVIVQDLWKQYGDVRAVCGVGFSIGEGEIFGLLGPNGAGKTTIIESTIGLREPDCGNIQICGIDVRAHPFEARQKFGAALQDTALQDKITPREALQNFGSFYRDPSGAGELLEKFALNEKADAAFDTLSGGQRQRLALALAFVNRPEVVFLDEPTAGLDPQARRDLHGRIAAMKAEGYSVLLTTHYIEEAEHLCDRIAILDAGRIVAEGTPQQVIGGSKAATSVSFRTSEPLNREWFAGARAIADLQCDGHAGSFTASQITRALAELAAVLDARGIEISDLHVRKASLEDVIIELTGAGLRE